jgi:hypothetical protein
MLVESEVLFLLRPFFITSLDSTDHRPMLRLTRGVLWTESFALANDPSNLIQVMLAEGGHHRVAAGFRLPSRC